MKNILVPTDFSDCAAYAVNVAFELAERNGATLHVFNKMETRTHWEELSDQDQKALEEEKQNIRKMDLLFEKWEDKALAKGIPFVKSWASGDLVKNIERLIEQLNIDFVVMGSHGASGKKEYFIGSNTQKVVRSLHLPILIVKNEVGQLDFKKVVFASNFNESDIPAFNYLLDFVRPFNPEIHLLSINTSGWFGQPYALMKAAMDDFKNLCGDLTCHSHFFRDWTVDAGVRNLSEMIGADLISISNKERHPLKRIFSGSNVEALVNHAEVPVLSIDFKKNLDLEE